MHRQAAFIGNLLNKRRLANLSRASDKLDESPGFFQALRQNLGLWPSIAELLSVVSNFTQEHLSWSSGRYACEGAVGAATLESNGAGRSGAHSWRFSFGHDLISV